MRQMARTNVPARSGLAGVRRRGGPNNKPVVASAAPAKISTRVAFEKGKSLIAAHPEVAGAAKFGTTTAAAPGSPEPTLRLGAMPRGSPTAVTEDLFVDALTAVMTGNVDLSDLDDSDGDDSIATVSTIDSHAEMNIIENLPVESSNDIANNNSLAVGKLFFYLDTKTPMALPAAAMRLTEGEGQTKKPQDAAAPTAPTAKKVVRDKKVAFHHSEEKKDDSGSGEYIRSVIAQKAKEADEEGLFEIGKSLFRMGERYLAQGKVEEAKETLARAQTFQKHSIRLITKRMAQRMHAQGLKHCDRGDKFLGIVLLGVAEILKHRPTPANIKLGTQVHAGYKEVCPRTKEFRDPRREIDACVKNIEKESLPLAHTMRAYAKSIRMSMDA